MLRVFSSIRKSLINEGKTVRYFKYAVGVFLLIVAGILVALQIQNWNEGRKLEQDRADFGPLTLNLACPRFFRSKGKEDLFNNIQVFNAGGTVSIIQ